MPPTMMQAVRVHDYGSADQLILEEIPRPEPQSNEVLIQVDSAGILPADWKARAGYFKAFRPAQFPYIPGSAISGIVAAVGVDVKGFEVGQAVFGRSPNGAYTEYTIATPETLALKPDSLSFESASTLSGGAATAWTAMFDDGLLGDNQKVLIQGAAGGVGLYAVQFAKWKKAHVIGTASTANVDFVYSLGADEVIDYTQTPFEDLIQDVDFVLDTIGGDVQVRSMDIIKRGGTLMSLLGEPPQEKAQALGIRAVNNKTLVSSQVLEQIAELISAGIVKAVVQAVFPLAEVKSAHELSQTGHGRGRIVLKIAG